MTDLLLAIEGLEELCHDTFRERTTVEMALTRPGLWLEDRSDDLATIRSYVAALRVLREVKS